MPEIDENGNPVAPAAPAPKAPKAPAAPAAPAGDEVVSLSRSEHDALQARLRKAEKEADKARAAAEEQRAAQERAEAERKGEYDRALALERERAEKIVARAREAALKATVLDRAVAKGLSATQARAAQRLLDRDAVTFADDEPDASSVDAALDAVMQEYPDIFTKAQANGSQGGNQAHGQNRPRNSGPVTPANPAGRPPIDGYISPEEYASLPMEVRRSATVRARLAASRPYWATEVPSDSFAQG